MENKLILEYSEKKEQKLNLPGVTGKALLYYMEEKELNKYTRYLTETLMKDPETDQITLFARKGNVYSMLMDTANRGYMLEGGIERGTNRGILVQYAIKKGAEKFIQEYLPKM